MVDIGCHRGDDTAYYLAKGFRVLAVEANPVLIEGCRRRFEQEIACGRLELIHACVSDRRDHVPFFVNQNDGWSSLVQRLGTRGAGAQSLMMSTMPIADVLTGRDVPHFLKMDVEGLEGRLLRAMSAIAVRPIVIALEVDFYEGNPIADLQALGYDRFCFVRQPNLLPDPALPNWLFTRCSSGSLDASLLEDPMDAASARQAFAAICGESYRWHDLYAFRAGDSALEHWLEVPGA